MNGINYSTLLGNKGLFQQTDSTVEDKRVLGKIAGAKVASKGQTEELKKNQDTVEINGQSREIPKAGYERPRNVAVNDNQKNEKYKKLDEEGIQEGIELSDDAKNLLAELKEKYADMDFSVVNWSSDEEQDYYASRTDKQYSVLIAPEALEAMAADEEVRARYEAVLDGAGENFEKIKEELGEEDAEQIHSFSITIDPNGKVSYAVQLLKDFAKNNQVDKKEDAKEKQQERIEKKREEKKKDEKERLEKIEADSIEELVSAIKQKLHPEEIETQDSESEEKIVVKA